MTELTIVIKFDAKTALLPEEVDEITGIVNNCCHDLEQMQLHDSISFSLSKKDY